MDTPRSTRLAQQFQREIATIIHQELKDPRVGFVTITRVQLSKDLRHAKIFFSCLGNDEERTRSQEALDHSIAFIYSLIKKRLRLKSIPELVFLYDESIAGSIALSERLDQLKDTSGGRPPPYQ